MLKMYSLDLQDTSTYLWWPSMMCRTSFKNHEKCHFSLWKPSEGFKREKWHFSWFFKTCSTHHRRSSKICRSILGVQRTHFEHSIMFLMAFGQISATCDYNWNLVKSPFGSKIHFSINRPEVSGCMIYGRKWKLEVF